MKTLIVVILDESGSMANKVNDVIGNFNSFLETQNKLKSDKVRLLMLKFNTEVNIVHLCKKIRSIRELSSMTYRPKGLTALCDAVNEGISLAEKAMDFDERVVCVFVTDGEDNSSKTTLNQVKMLISNYESRSDWTFHYIGEKPENWTSNSRDFQSKYHFFCHINCSSQEIYLMTFLIALIFLLLFCF